MFKSVSTLLFLCTAFFCQVCGQEPDSATAYAVALGNDELVLTTPGGNAVLAYRYTVNMPPNGVDAAYGRAGYIHPLRTLAGKVLTQIQPADHYHHYGIWNPWTRIAYKAQVYDLWNIGDKQGTIRFSEFKDIFHDSDKAGFEAIHDHIIFHSGIEETIIKETWKISISQLDAKRYQCDMLSTLTPITDADVTLKEYRYAGLGFRATEEWTNTNSEVLTSTGKTRKDADGSQERWAMVFGKLGDGEGGILFLSHPDNYNSPEPIRVWPADANGGRGDILFNFSPTKTMDWILRAGETYALTYRLIVFDGVLDGEEAEKMWQEFAH